MIAGCIMRICMRSKIFRGFATNYNMLNIKADSGVHEHVIDLARQLLQDMSEYDAMHSLKNGGIKPECAYLAVKAAKILDEPYAYKEAQNRMILCEES